MTISVLVDPHQERGRFGPYIAEILRAEGFASIAVVPMAGAAGTPRADDVLVVTRMSLPRAAREELMGYLNDGGRAVLIRPSMSLLRRLGVPAGLGIRDRGYVRPRPDHPIAGRLPSSPIETHQPVDVYGADLPPGSAVIADLWADSTTDAHTSSVIEVPVGRGTAIIFQYDVGKAVSLIRQGDPDRVGGRAFHEAGPYGRAQDLLIGYADESTMHLPQADIHAALLVNAVHAAARRPQLRWWYYPTPDLTTAVVLDSDDDYSSSDAFDDIITSVEALDGHVTIYLMMGPSRESIATPEKVAAWRGRGHSFGIHHNMFDPAFAGRDEEELYRAVVTDDLARFAHEYGGTPTTNRNHCVGWTGYVEPAKIWSETGVRMDFNMCTYGPGRLKYLSGSGRPMRFVEADGTVIDCFQQMTRIWDDATVIDLLTNHAEEEAERAIELLHDSMDQWFTPLTVLSHPVSFHEYSKGFHLKVWREARRLGVPIWSAFEWAEFVDARDQATIEDERWDGREITATVRCSSPRGSLTLMLPVPADDIESIAIDGQAAQTTERSIFGVAHTQFVIPAGPQVGQRRVQIILRDSTES